MKTVLGLLFCTFFALVSGHHGGQNSEECNCGIFATTFTGVVKVNDFPHEHVSSCGEVAICKTFCQDMWRKTVGDGNLDNKMTPRGATVGQQFCQKLSLDGIPTFGPHKVFGYSSICQGPLIYNDNESLQELCCTNGRHIKCPENTHDHEHILGHDHEHTH